MTKIEKQIAIFNKENGGMFGNVSFIKCNIERIKKETMEWQEKIKAQKPYSLCSRHWGKFGTDYAVCGYFYDHHESEHNCDVFYADIASFKKAIEGQTGEDFEEDFEELEEREKEKGTKIWAEINNK